MTCANECLQRDDCAGFSYKPPAGRGGGSTAAECYISLNRCNTTFTTQHGFTYHEIN